MIITKLQAYFTILIAVLWLCGSSCNTVKYLDEGDVLLTENIVKFTGTHKIRNKPTIAYDLTTQYRQKANTNFFFLFPRERIYLRAARKTNRVAQWRKRVIGELPTLLDENQAEATTQSMVYYLQNKGYFDASVYYEIDRHPKKPLAAVTYKVNTGALYTIDTTLFASLDTAMQHTLAGMSNQSLLKAGEPVARDIYDQEATRITQYLRNNGYAYFYPNSIAPLQGDSTGSKVAVTLEVLRPASADSIHKQYRIGKVAVFPDYDATVPITSLRDSLIEGVHFYSNQLPYRVRATVMRSQVYMREGELYRQENIDKTNRAFGALGVFKFVTIKQQIDSLEPNKINFYIYLSRSKQLEFGIDFDVNYTNQRSNIRRGFNLLGFSISPSLRNRNVFGGAELLTSRAEAGLETATGNMNFINAIDISFTNELSFPKFIDYLGLWRTMNKIGNKRKMVGDRFYQIIREKATTRVAVEYNFLKRINFFEYNLFNASFGYDLPASARHRFLINHVGVDLLLPRTDSTFQVILDANPFLQRSFGKQLFTGLLFKDFNYIYTGRRDRNGNSWNISAYSEVSGTEIWLANTLYNSFSANITPDTFQFTRIVDGMRDTVELAQYAKLQADIRYNKQFNPRSALALRLYTGVGFPFGFSQEVPYVKQYFVGGPNSMRGWDVRGLGPGSYVDDEISDSRFFYQTGDIRLEFNIEYRFNLFKIWSAVIEGATFIDAGNIWALNDDGRQGGQFLWKPKLEGDTIVNDAFYKQIAINTGFGFRVDLSYFIFRVDMGYPLRYPSLHPSNGNRGARWQQVLALNRMNYVIGLGYPF